jgi:hypothetical protein
MESKLIKKFMKTYTVDQNGIKTLFIFYNENEYNSKIFEKQNLINMLYIFFNPTITDKLLENDIPTSNHRYLRNFDEKRMLVVCTQNSKSCTKDHFQHMIKTIVLEDKSLKDFGIHLIDKADATSTSNSSSFSCARKILGDKPYNCRTRIYGNRLLISPEYKENNGKIIKGSTYIKPLFIPGFSFSSGCAFVKKCEKRIINIKTEGVGGILFDILLLNPNINGDKL